MPSSMKSFNAKQWGEAMASPACNWAEVLAPDTGAGNKRPHVIVVAIDYEGQLQAWFAVWPLAGQPEALRIVKTKGALVAKTTNVGDSSAMTQFEQHLRNIGKHRRYWLIWNEKRGCYEDFKDAT